MTPLVDTMQPPTEELRQDAADGVDGSNPTSEAVVTLQGTHDGSKPGVNGLVDGRFFVEYNINPLINFFFREDQCNGICNVSACVSMWSHP